MCVFYFVLFGRFFSSSDRVVISLRGEAILGNFLVCMRDGESVLHIANWVGLLDGGLGLSLEELGRFIGLEESTSVPAGDSWQKSFQMQSH